jgi:hypothetical protein
LSFVKKIKEQIGNAVPPSIAEAIFPYIRKRLEDVNGICKSKEVGEVEGEETRHKEPELV